MVTVLKKINKDYMTPREVSELCEVSISTVYYWIKTKEVLKAKTKGSRYYVKRKDVEKYMSKGGIGL